MQHETKDSSEAEEAGRWQGGAVETSDLPDRPVAPSALAGDQDRQLEASSPADQDVRPAEVATVPTFLNEIARQMHSAVESERARISAETANSLDEHVRQVRIRAANEAEELRRLAEEDVDHINEWSAAEAERLQRETQDRIGARREDLERHLRQHDALIEREISGGSEAVQNYQADLDRFVDRLALEQEPTEIAQLASQLPEPPRIDEIASAARAEAMAEMSRSEAAHDVNSAGLGLVGVMDSSVVKETTGRDTSPDGQVVAMPDTGILGAHNTAALTIRLVLVFLVVGITGTLVFLVGTGRLALPT